MGGTFDLLDGLCDGHSGLNNHFAHQPKVCDGVAWCEQGFNVWHRKLWKKCQCGKWVQTKHHFLIRKESIPYSICQVTFLTCKYTCQLIYTDTAWFRTLPLAEIRRVDRIIHVDSNINSGYYSPVLFLIRGFHKLDEIGNNDIIGIKGLTMWKQTNPVLPPVGIEPRPLMNLCFQVQHFILTRTVPTFFTGNSRTSVQTF